MEIIVQSTHFLKPSKKTPQNLSHFKFSLLDQRAPSSYINMIFYYNTTRGEFNVSDRCSQLVNSLSEVLNLYHPLAGRITPDQLGVDCSDQGVKYLGTQVRTTLDDFLQQGPKIDHVNQLIGAPDRATKALVIVQVNIFDCGSIAIGVSASHKVTDAYNLVSFVNHWASTNRTGCSNGENFDCPSFDNLDSIFKPTEASSIEILPLAVEQTHVIRTRRYVFNRTAISNLRAKLGSETGNHSRLTLVTSLIWKAMISIDHVKSGKFRDSLLAPAITLRGKTWPPISESSFGNVWVPYSIWCLENGTEPKFGDLVALVEDATRKMVNWLPKANGEEICSHSKACLGEVAGELKQGKFCIITSWCRFPVYEADFGWGKPEWVSGAGRSLDMVALMDDKHGDGIEAWVNLNEEDMKLFEQDQDIIAFTAKLI